MRRPGRGEDRLHELFRQSFRGRRGLGGPGDDCARVSPPAGAQLVLSCDQVVPGVHVPADCGPAVLARKLVRRTLSDLAAAGASPWALAWTAAAPAELGFAWMSRLARAFLAEAELFGAAVIGGDLSNAPSVVLSCTALGRESRRPAPGRGGARAGDWLCVTGRLGGAVRSGRHLRPEPRLAEGRLLVERYHAHAMIDLSDGLARDLPRLLEASGVGARIDLDALPLSGGLQRDAAGLRAAVAEGEDYELLAALEPERAKRAFADPVLRRTGLHVIGEAVAGGRLEWLFDGQEFDLEVEGWEHEWT